MAKYDHLPIYRDAYDLALHIEKIVRNFSRYHKYTLGTKLRESGYRIIERIIEANNRGGKNLQEDRLDSLLRLRQEVESFKVMARLCHDAQGFASTRAYLHVAERIAGIAKQTEGWIKSSQGDYSSLRRKRRRETRSTKQHDANRRETVDAGQGR